MPIAAAEAGMPLGLGYAVLDMLWIIINDGQPTWRMPQNQQILWDFVENYLLTWTNTLLYW